MNPIALRLLSQQLVSPQFASPTKVVAHMGAVQAQDYRMMRWAVMMRMKKPLAEAFCQAYDAGEIIRLHLLRGTWQLVSADDYHWMLRLYADKAERVIRSWMKSNKVFIDDEELYSIREILVDTCERKEPTINGMKDGIAIGCDVAGGCATSSNVVYGSATKEDFARALVEHGIEMDAHRLSYHIRLAELSGTLCSGCLTPMQATYALVEKKLKGRKIQLENRLAEEKGADGHNVEVPTKSSFVEMDRDEMLMLLARKYFQSHSPATFEDYLWWSGLIASECRKGIELLGSELRKEKWQGYDFYLHESCRTRGFRKGISHLLPPFDEYLIGYKSRELSLSLVHTHHAYTNNGIFFPIIAHDGIVCGNWTPWEKSLKASFFLPQEEELSLDRQWKAFCQLKK